MRAHHLEGRRFGKLTVRTLAQVGPRRWLCVCDCGRERLVTAGNLRTGNTKACGSCHGNKNATKHGAAPKDSAKRTGTYNSWRSMRRRCFDANRDSAAHYAGAGITVCERWNDFALFLADMGERPEGTSLDRIDSAGNYEPGNCRWATPTEQTRNRRSTRTFTWKGQTKTVGEWAEALGITYEAARCRLKNNGDLELHYARVP